MKAIKYVKINFTFPRSIFVTLNWGYRELYDWTEGWSCIYQLNYTLKNFMHLACETLKLIYLGFLLEYLLHIAEENKY